MIIIKTKAQIKGYYLTQIKGQTLDILWVFLLSRIFTTANSSNHSMTSSQIPPHNGFSTQWVFLFYYYNLQGSCLRTVIQPCRSPHIVGFFFFTTNHTTLNGITRWGSPLRPLPWAQSLILTVHGLGLIPPDIPTGPNLHL